MTAMLHGDDAAEYVSALADGETIPSAFAQHIGTCAACKARLHDYLAIGAELRRIASLDADQPVPALSIEKRRTARSVWKKGLETMRIPKYAFALLVLAVVVLASSLTIVKVGAHSSGSVLMLNIKPNSDAVYRCVIDTGKQPGQCAVMFSRKDHMVGVEIENLARDGDRVQLGVRTMVGAMVAGPNRSRHGGMSIVDLRHQPQTQHWFEAGQTMQLDIDGIGPVQVNGEWSDHMPSLTNEPQLDPGPDELRMVSPVILRDKQTLGDMEGGSVTAGHPGMAVQIYNPGVGRFLISLSPMKDAVQANVRLNRISFQLNGRYYLFVTGAPVASNEHVWVLYQPDFKPLSSEQGGFIGSGLLSQIAPEAILPESQPRK